MSSPKSQIPAFKISPGQTFPEVVLYTGRNFEGDSWRTNLSYSQVGNYWREVISSIIVVSGIWEFCSGPSFTEISCRLCPGYYPDLGEAFSQAEVCQRGIMSFRCVSQS
jgi:hypothetical protein